MSSLHAFFGKSATLPVKPEVTASPVEAKLASVVKSVAPVHAPKVLPQKSRDGESCPVPVTNCPGDSLDVNLTNCCIAAEICNDEPLEVCVQNCELDVNVTNSSLDVVVKEPVELDSYCFQVENKRVPKSDGSTGCAALCVINEENIYKGTPVTLVGENVSTGTWSVDTTSIPDDCLFKAESLVISLCLTGDLDCDSTGDNLSISYHDGNTLIDSLNPFFLPGEFKRYALSDGAKILYRIEIDLTDNYDSNILLPSGLSGAFTVVSDSDTVSSVILNGSVRKCQQDCRCCFKAEIPDHGDDAKEICHGSEFTYDAEAFKALHGTDGEYTYNWVATSNNVIGFTHVGTNETEIAEGALTHNILFETQTVTYIVTPTDMDGLCKGASFTVQVSVLPPLTVEIDGPTALCEGVEECYEAIVSGGLSGDSYEYEWSLNPSGFPGVVTGLDTEKLTLVASGAYSGTVSVTISSVSGDDGCGTASTGVFIEVFEAPNPELRCNGYTIDCTGSFQSAILKASATGGAEPYTFALEGPSGSTIDPNIAQTGVTGSQEVCYTVDTEGEYTLTVTTAEGCSVSVSKTVDNPCDVDHEEPLQV